MYHSTPISPLLLQQCVQLGHSSALRRPTGVFELSFHFIDGRSGADALAAAILSDCLSL